MLIHTTPFFWGVIILFFFTILFYIIFASLIYYWHEKMITVLVVPLLYTFEFFIAGFLVVSLVSLVVQYLPAVLVLIK